MGPALSFTKSPSSIGHFAWLNPGVMNPRNLLSAASLGALMGSYLWFTTPAQSKTALALVPSRATETLTKVITTTSVQTITVSAPTQTMMVTETAPIVTTTHTVLPVAHTTTLTKPPITHTETSTILPIPVDPITITTSLMTPPVTLTEFLTLTRVETITAPAITHSVTQFRREPTHASTLSKELSGDNCICLFNGVIGRAEMMPGSLVMIKAYGEEAEEKDSGEA